VPNNEFELSGMQNFLELIFPFGNRYDVSSKDFLVALDRLDLDWLLPLIKEVLPQERETIALTRDPKLLEVVVSKRGV